MSITSRWDNPEKTIIRIDFEGEWTWNEFEEAMAEARTLMLGVDHRVDVIANMRPGVMPRMGNALAYGAGTMRKWPSNSGVIVVVTNPYVQAIVTVFKQLNKELGANLRIVNSLEDAYKIVARQNSLA